MEARASSSERVRKAAPVRPPDLIHAIDERPRLFHLALLGFQHVAVICPYLVIVTLIVQAAGAPVEVASSAVSLGMLAVAVATLLQAYRFGPVGSGYLIPPVVSAIYFAPALHAPRGAGLTVVFAMTAFAGLFKIFAWVLPRMRHVFPPVVSGFIVMAVGAEGPAVSRVCSAASSVLWLVSYCRSATGCSPVTRCR
jgi:xanthine permease XanP